MILAIEIRLDSHMFPRIYAYRLCIRLAVLLAIDPYLPPLFIQNCRKLLFSKLRFSSNFAMVHSMG